MVKNYPGGIKRGELGRPDTPDVVPEVPIAAAGIEATPSVVQAVTVGAIVRRSRPPVPVPRIVDVTIAVAATGNGGVVTLAIGIKVLRHI